jgi:hypothetical protein
MYAHHITEIDQADIISVEILLLNLKREGATKQMKIVSFLKTNNAKWTLQLTQ